MSLAKLIADAERSSPAAAARPPSELESEFSKASRHTSRILRVEVAGMLHDWFCVEEMSDFLRTPAFAKVLRENIARYFHVPVQRQAVYDEDGLLTSNADFRRALQRVSPKIYVYDMQDMAQELRDRTVEELQSLEAEVQLSWDAFGASATAKENSAPEQSAKQAAVKRHTLPPQSTLRQTVSTGNLTMPLAFQPNRGPSKVQKAPGVSPRRSVTPRLQSARTSCVVVPLAQTPRTTSTSKERTYMCNGMQLKLQTAAPTQAVSSRPTLLVRAASVPAVPKIIRQGTLPTTARCQQWTQTPRAIRTQTVQVRATQFVPVSRPPVHEQKPRTDGG